MMNTNLNQNENELILYWVHLPEHTEEHLQGYIGVTKYFDQRMNEHRRKASNEYFQNAINKYGWDNLIKEIIVRGKIAAGLGCAYIKGLEELMSGDWKFDIVIGNPPFNDDQSQKGQGKGNMRSTPKKLHIEFIRDALRCGEMVAMIAPTRGWWQGSKREKYVKEFGTAGLSRVVNVGAPFATAEVTDVGIFYFNTGAEALADDFAPICTHPRISIIDVFPFYGMVGESRDVFEHELCHTGRYKYWCTQRITGYSDNVLFHDKTRGNWRVVFNHNASADSIGNVSIAGPDDFLSGSMSCLLVADEQQASAVRNYLLSPAVADVQRACRVSATNSKFHFGYIDGTMFKPDVL